MTLLVRFADIEIRGTIQENGNSRLDLIEIHVAEIDDFCARLRNQIQN